ncbi:MAG: LysE family translocator [Rhodobiaceae bacterium]|nr:LysE family translocator [Rhodobiaceae bacterium]
MSIEYLITALILVIAPGTGVIYTVATGLTSGRWSSISAAFGCTLGILPAMLASVLGLAAILHTSALAFQVLKYLGVAYLLFLAWKTLNDSGPASLNTGKPGRGGYRRIAVHGMLVNVLNPKLSLFFLAFLPQFIDPAAGSVTQQVLLLGAVFMAMTFAVFSLYGVFASYAGNRLLRSETAMTWMRRSVAAAFAGFGLKLALSER